MKEPGSARSIHAPSAIGDMAAHTHCNISVPTVLLCSATEPVLTHPKGDTHELFSGRNNITNLVENWDRLQSFEGDSDRVVEGEKDEGRFYSARRVSQEFLRLQNIFEHRSQEVEPTDVHSISSLNVSFNNIPTNIKGAATNVSRIPRRYTSVQKQISVGFSESESNMDSLSSTYCLSSSKMIEGRTLLGNTKASKKRGRGEKVAA